MTRGTLAVLGAVAAVALPGVGASSAVAGTPPATGYTTSKLVLGPIVKGSDPAIRAAMATMQPAIPTTAAKTAAYLYDDCRPWHNYKDWIVPPWGPTIWKLHNDGIWCSNYSRITQVYTERPPSLYTAPGVVVTNGPDAMGYPWFGGSWHSHSWATIIAGLISSTFNANVCTEIHVNMTAAAC